MKFTWKKIFFLSLVFVILGFTACENPDDEENNHTSYTVTYTDNGEYLFSSTGYYGGGYTPEKTGYVFEGWYTDIELTKAFDSSKRLTANITLYAKWREKTCTVSFKTWGGSTVIRQIIKYGEKISRPENPTREGYTFDCWCTGNDLATEFNFDTPIKTDLLYLYARWNGKWLVRDTHCDSAESAAEAIGNLQADSEISVEGGYVSSADIAKIVSAIKAISNNVKVDLSLIGIDGSSIQTIAENTFSDCTALKNITLPNGLKSINENAFKSCTSLEKVKIPSTVTSIIQSFAGCTKLAEFSVDSQNSIFSAENGVLYNNEYGKRLYIYPEGKSGDSFTIPTGTTGIHAWAFKNCTNLKSVTIPNTVTLIGSEAFKGSGLTSVSIPDSVEDIGTNVFEDCTALAKVQFLPSRKMTSIPAYCFQGCTALVDITVSSGILYIGNGAFQNCSALTSATFSPNLMSIGFYAFRYCSSLSTIKYDSTVLNWNTNVKRNSGWAYGTAASSVTCTNGTVQLSNADK